MISADLCAVCAGRGLAVHHAVPVSVCPGSPAQFYGRIAHLPLHPPFYQQHQEDEGELRTHHTHTNHTHISRSFHGSAGSASLYRIRTILPDPRQRFGSGSSDCFQLCTESCRLNDCKNHTTLGLLIKSFNSFCKRLTLKRDLKNDFSLCYKRFMISKMGFFVRIRLNLTV